MASWLYNTLLGGDTPTPGAIRLPDSATPSPAPPPPYTRTKSPRPRAPLSLPALNALRGKRFVLASASPRRKQLLSLIGLTDIEVIPSKFAENLDKTQYTPFEYVLATATNKCADVYRAEIDNAALGEPAMVLAADTVIVTYEGEIIEKPRSEEGHLAMLKTLRDGMPHKVYTAVVAMVPLETVVHPGYAQESHVEETTVEFDKMVTDELLEAYVRTREGADKAGGYAIQGTGSILVKRIEGTFDNVVGLPLRGTLRVIEKAMSAEEMQEEEEEGE